MEIDKLSQPKVMKDHAHGDKEVVQETPKKRTQVKATVNRERIQKECPGRVRCYGRNITKTSLKRKAEINALKQAHSEEVSTLRDEFQDKIDRLQNAFKTVIQQCNPQINIESIKDLLGLSHGDANSSPNDIRPQMHSSTSTHAPCHGK
ncbi:unnamed protein product [Vicia faba]|uniref:Uncharacterized protein n=1 Tax=Vicia faba TaxID=3906 RepID=A0AAV0ZG28_VICFA|nr:unnamed protein product [Vicia faba]